MIHFHIITIFPHILDSYINESILKRAQKDKKIAFQFYDIREFTSDKHRRVDDKSYGGGPGMVMQAEPILKAVKKAVGKKKNVKVFILSPRGRQFTNTVAAKYAEKYKHIVLIAGRYEGIDARVKKILKAEELSIGPYTLSGGELPAAVVAEAIARHVPGVLGKEESVEESRAASAEVYTRPETITEKGEKHTVPKLLTSGDHKKIEEWRKGKSRETGIKN